MTGVVLCAGNASSDDNYVEKSQEGEKSWSRSVDG